AAQQSTAQNAYGQTQLSENRLGREVQLYVKMPVVEQWNFGIQRMLPLAVTRRESRLHPGSSTARCYRFPTCTMIFRKAAGVSDHCWRMPGTSSIPIIVDTAASTGKRPAS